MSSANPLSSVSQDCVFMTGGTGYLGSYVIERLLADTDCTLLLLTRAQEKQAAREKLWRAMQMHWTAEDFSAALPRISFVAGDLEKPGLGLVDAAHTHVVQNATSVLHIAASLNRKSEKACLNANLRGTLHVLELAEEVRARGTLRRYSHVSTVAVAGERNHETVSEDDAIDWKRSDYDSYARTKKFAEYMGRHLLPNTSKIFFRPSIVLGDSRFGATTQFEMVRAFCALADLPALPLAADARLDIVPADFVGNAIATLHMRENSPYDTYHLSSGVHSVTVGEVCNALSAHRNRPAPRYLPQLGKTFDAFFRALNRLPRGGRLGKWGDMAQQLGALLKVFWPYITYDTVFDNSRVVAELGTVPAAFSTYCGPLYDFAKEHGFRYPYEKLGESNGHDQEQSSHV